MNDDDGYSVGSEEVFQSFTDNDNDDETSICSDIKHLKKNKKTSPQSQRPPLLFQTRTSGISLSDKVIKLCLSL